MDGIVFLNGEFMNANEAKISAFDRGFIFGDGIYEVVPVVGGVLVDKIDFWARFEASLAAISLKLPYDKGKFEEILREAVARNDLKEGGVYIQITRGAAARSFAFIDGLEPTCFIFCYEAKITDNPLAESGIEIASVPDIRWKRRDIKSVSLLAQCYAKNEAVKVGAFEGFMIEDGFVTEGTSSSAFIIKDGVLITKPLSNEILPGIRRKVILGFAEKAGLRGGANAVRYGIGKRAAVIYLGGDIITEIAGQAVSNLSEYYAVLEDKKPNESIAVTVLRGNKTVKLTLTLSERNDE